MTGIVLVLTALWARPAAVPVSGADVRHVAEREAELARAGPAAAVAGPEAERVPGRFAIGFEPGRADAAAAWAAGAGGRIVRVDEALGFAVAEFGPASGPAGPLPAEVRYVEPDYRVRAALVPDDPFFGTRQWDKYVMYADEAWDLVTGGQLKLAIVDNGVDYLHPDLVANFNQAELGYDFVRGDGDPRPDNPEVPEAFHGTHVAGIAAAVANNGVGVAGWAQVTLLAVRCLNDTGQGNTTDVASGIRWAADHGAKIVNMSLGASASPQPLTSACEYAEQRGVLLVAASGNEGTGNVNYPAALAECMAVGATDQDSRLASFSNYGDEQEVVAPGVAVVSTAPGSSYFERSGTSMATPQVAGVAALVLARNPSLTLGRLRSIVGLSAIDMGVSGWDSRYGYGLVNARRAVELAQALALGGAGTAATAGACFAGPAALESPAWVERATAIDCAGRVARSGGAVPGGRLELGPGAWFVRFEGRGRTELRRVLVLD